MNWNDHLKDVEPVIYELASSLPKIDDPNRNLGQNKSEILAAALDRIDMSSFDSKENARDVIWHFWKVLYKVGIICSDERLWYLSIYGGALCNRYRNSLLSEIVKEREATIHKNLMERLGVSAIESFFCRLGWIFRERTHTDYGIDADVEMPEKGRLSSRHIALQIKSGVSFFSSPGKVNYAIDRSHFYYWLLSDRPVVFMVYDPRDGSIYWEQILPGADVFQSDTFPLKNTKKLTEDSKKDFEKMVVSYLPIIQITGIDYQSDEYAQFVIQSYYKSCCGLLEQYSGFSSNLTKYCRTENSLYIDLLRIEIASRYRVDAVYLTCFFDHVYHSNNRSEWSEKLKEFIEQQEKWMSFLSGIKESLSDYHSQVASSQSDSFSFIFSMCFDVFSEYITMGERYLSFGKETLEEINSITKASD